MKIILSVPEKHKLEALQATTDGCSGFMSVKSPAVRNYESLELQGLVMRSWSPDDPSVVAYTITDKGRRYDNPIPLTAKYYKKEKG